MSSACWMSCRESDVGLYCERHGPREPAGAAVVLLHGWGLHGGIWAQVVPALAEHFSVTVPDLPGHGRSRRPPEFDTLEALAGEVAAVLDGPATWIGWSLGALVALVAARRYPQAVAKLVLVGATPRFVQAPGWPCAMDPDMLEQFAVELESDYAGTLQRFLSLQIGEGEGEWGTLRSLHAELYRYGEPETAALRSGLQLLKETDLRKDLHAISVPTRVIHGERDKLVPVEAGKYLAAQLPVARFEIIESAGHAPFLSHPSLFLQKLEGFVRG